MLSIAQSDNAYYCFEWIPTENGPKVVNYKSIKENFSYRRNNFNEVISKIKPKIRDVSDSLSIVVNINNVKISSYIVDNIENSNQAIDWYEENILDKDYLKKFEVFYYPMNSNENSQLLLVVSFNKVLKKEIKLLASKFSYNLLYLSVDIFSAYMTAQQLYKTPLDQDSLIWKIDKNNLHYLTYYENNNLSSFVSFRISKKSYNFYHKIGTIRAIDVLENFINKIIIERKSYNNIKNIFVYQTKSNYSLIKSYVNDKKLNVKLLNISNIFNEKVKSEYNLLPYVENGISLRGVDV